MPFLVSSPKPDLIHRKRLCNLEHEHNSQIVQDCGQKEGGIPIEYISALPAGLPRTQILQTLCRVWEIANDVVWEPELVCWSGAMQTSCRVMKGVEHLYRCYVTPESPNKSKQRLYCVCTVTVESRDVRRSLTKSLALSENECVSVMSLDFCGNGNTNSKWDWTS